MVSRSTVDEVPPYALPTPCPVLTYAMLRLYGVGTNLASRLAISNVLLGQATLLQTPYAMSGTNLGNGATGDEGCTTRPRATPTRRYHYSV
eukprot:2945914-Rhodomonas_salina.1